MSTSPESHHNQNALQALAANISTWANELGFQQVGIADLNLSAEADRLHEWLAKGYQGDMSWLGEHADMRIKPEKLLPGATRVISVRIDYLPGDTDQIKVLKDPNKAYISRYALGRDYHKMIRKRLAKLCDKICDSAKHIPSVTQRPFVDSAPVLERPLAAKSGLGWIGKHTLLLHPKAGSWFFLGEILTNIPLPTTEHTIENQCGDCTACLKVCPTDAFPKPYELDARRCISYLTIENKGSIPIEFREAMGNRVFGCDDCQAICPWNKFAKPTCEKDFQPRHGLENADLVTLFNWDEKTFLKNTEGSAIRRIGYERWLRNLAIGLGNSGDTTTALSALKARRDDCSPMVAEHIAWAIQQLSLPSKKRKRKIKRDEQDN